MIPFSASPSAAADLRKDCQSGQIAACTQILQSNPSDISALGNRGIGFRVIGEYDRAVADLNAAVGLDPRIAGLYRATPLWDGLNCARRSPASAAARAARGPGGHSEEVRRTPQLPHSTAASQDRDPRPTARRSSL